MDNAIQFPNKKYNIIYADPPWKFSSKELQKYGGTRFTSIEKHYSVQDKNWIMNLPVSSIAEDNCALFMWCTDAHLKEGIETIEAWGFKYITVAFIWEKLTSNGNLVANLGAWTMKNCEMCLFATRGSMLPYKQRNNIYQLIKAERTIHSRKPKEARNRIELLFGELPRIEIFAREKADGWDVWGNEV